MAAHANAFFLGRQDVEPLSGLALRGAARTQLALPVGPVRAHGSTWLPRLRHVPLFPIAWYELGGQAAPGATWPLRVAQAAPGACRRGSILLAGWCMIC
jgi:hypothetical protein